MRKVIDILLLCLVVMTACTKQEDPASTGNIKVVLSTMPPQTKAETPGDGLVADGGGIYMDNSDVPDLYIIIFDGEGHLAAYYPHDALLGDKPTHNIVQEAQSSNSALEIEVTFRKTKDGTNFDDGDYHLYAVANAEGLWDFDGGDSWDDVMDALADGSLDETGFTALKFDELADGETPSIKNNRMPLSAVGSIQVSSGIARANATMLRCLCKLNLTIENLSGSTLTLDGLSLGQFNANTGYLIKQEDNDIPAGTTYSEVTILKTEDDDEDDPDDILIPTGSHKILTNKYLFPNINPGQHLLNIRFGGEQGKTTFTLEEYTGANPDPTKNYVISFPDGEQPGYIYYDEDATGTKLLIKEESAISGGVPSEEKYFWRFFYCGEGEWGRHDHDIQNVGSGKYIMATGAENTYYERTITWRPGFAYEITSSSTKPSELSAPVSWRFENAKLKQSPTDAMINVEGTSDRTFYLTRGKSLDYQGGDTGNTESDVYVHTGVSVNTHIKVYEAIPHIHGTYNDVPIRDKYNNNITGISRNQNLDITIRVSYSVTFGYTLELWTGKNENIHFD